MTSELAQPVRIRAAVSGDIPRIIALEQTAATAAHWNAAAYAAVFAPNAPSRIVLVAQDATDQLCGFVVARAVADECELENIAVVSHAVRQGIGSALLLDLIREARALELHRIFLEVRDSNHAARQLYEKIGFVEASRRKAYYTDPSEDAILYSLTL